MNYEGEFIMTVLGKFNKKAFKKPAIIITLIIIIIYLIFKPPFIFFDRYTDISLINFISNFHFTYSKRLEVNLMDGEDKKLRYFKNLKYLNVQNANDLSFLYNMKGLEELHLRKNPYGKGNPSDFVPLFKLKNLKYFRGVGLEHLTDLSNFLNMKDLREFDLWSMDIDNSNMNIISKMTQLESLGLVNNKIEDYALLKNLINLKELQLRGSNISDLSIISNMECLEILAIDKTEVTDFSLVFSLSKLKDLYVDENALTEDEINLLENKGVNVYER